MTSTQSKRLARREKARRAAERQQRIKWAALTVAVTILIVGAFAVLSSGSDDPSIALAPDFELETNTGETVKLSDYRGRPVALIFMHTY